MIPQSLILQAVCLVFAVIRSSFKNERGCLYSTFILHLAPNHTHHYGSIQSVSNIPTVVRVHHVADFLRNVHRVSRYKSDKTPYSELAFRGLWIKVLHAVNPWRRPWVCPIVPPSMTDCGAFSDPMGHGKSNHLFLCPNYYILYTVSNDWLSNR